MDDRTEPEPPKWVGFRTYADGTFRTEGADPPERAQRYDDERYDAEAAADAWDPNDPWRQTLRLHRGQAPAPAPPLDTPRRRAIGPALLTGALVCCAAAVGFVLARSDFRAPAEQQAVRPIPDAPSRPVQVAQALPAVSANPAAPPPSDARPGAVRLERLRPAPLAAPKTPLVPARREVVPPAPGEAPVRVFVHITDAAQLPAADRIRSELNGLRVADRPVATPPVRFVAGSPHRTEVRCLKHADCPAAHRVAGYLARTLGAPVAVVDMSRTYERDRAVRAGSLELWLRS